MSPNRSLDLIIKLRKIVHIILKGTVIPLMLDEIKSNLKSKPSRHYPQRFTMPSMHNPENPTRLASPVPSKLYLTSKTRDDLLREWKTKEQMDMAFWSSLEKITLVKERQIEIEII